jgi:hypothetical protein
VKQYKVFLFQLPIYQLIMLLKLASLACRNRIGGVWLVIMYSQELPRIRLVIISRYCYR